MLENIVEKSNIRFREGFFEFLEFLHEKQIPIIIISAGVANCIEIFLKDHHALYDNITIISNLIKFNSQGFITEIPKFIINPANKNMITFPKDLQKKLKNRDNILLFGDVPGDIRMIENRDTEKTLSIAFANKDEDIVDLKRFFDIVSEDSEIFDILEEKIKELN